MTVIYADMLSTTGAETDLNNKFNIVNKIQFKEPNMESLWHEA